MENLSEQKPSRLTELAEQGALALRRQVQDVLSVLAMPATWRLQAPQEILSSLLDVLVQVVHLDVALVRIEDEGGVIERRFPAKLVGTDLVAAWSCQGSVDPPRFTLAEPNSLGRTDVRLLAVTPIGEQGQIIVGSWRENFPTPQEELVVRTVADQAALAMQSSRQLRARLRLAQERAQLEQLNGVLTRLHTISDRLSRARTSDEVAEVVLTEGLVTVRAQAAAAFFVQEGTGELGLVHAVGGPVGHPIPHSDIPPEVHRHLVQSGLQAFERVDTQTGTFACVRLCVERRVLGALVFTFAERRTLSQNERSFVQAVAHQAAQAFDRARLLEAEQRARVQTEALQRRTALLAEASALLTGALEIGPDAASLAELVASHVADVGMVELQGVSDDADAVCVLARADSSRGRPRTALGARPDGEGTPGVLLRNLNPQQLAGVLPADLPRDRLLTAGVREATVVPIHARGRRVGSISFGALSADRLTQADLELAQELARRVGFSFDNARLYRDARMADRRKDEFLAMLGHELRNPLAPIRTALHLMQMRGEQHFQRERGIIQRQVEHMVSLVDDLLDVSRITRGKIELKRERVEVAAILARAVEMTSPLLERSAHHLVLSCANETLAVIGDASRLAQIVANLLNNSAKYTERGGRIFLCAARKGDHAEIRVRDTGIGISPDILRRVFDLFVQDHRAIDRSQGGLGLGLAIVKSLVELHGGEVTASSEGPGRGSEFVIRLPAVAEQAEASAPAMASGGANALSQRALRLRVLVVDDNVEAAEMLADVLETAGYRIQVAFDGPNALKLSASFEPHVALVDIGLPVMDGYELAKKLRQQHDRLHLVAVTGYGQERDRLCALDAGYNAHLVKPLDVHRLEELLSEVAATGIAETAFASR